MPKTFPTASYPWWTCLASRRACRGLALAALLFPALGWHASGASIALTWVDNANNETGFRIERAAGGGAYTSLATTAANVTSYTDTTALASTTYSYRVLAFNAVGDSPYSNVATSAGTPVGNNTAPTISNIANQVVNEDSATGAIAFTIGDGQTGASSLVVTASSSNGALVPATAIILGGSGINRTITITPAAHVSGSATITVTVSDGALTASDPFTLTVNAVNDAPTISNTANQSIAENSTLGPLTFTVGDIETATTSLSMFGSSSNLALVPNGAIVFGGSGSNRTVTITPTTNLSGSATITINVSDGSASASDTFVLTVNAVNDAPDISEFPDIATSNGTPTEALEFSVADPESAAGSLIVSGTSSRTTLVPNTAIVFGGSGANRTVTLTPVAGQSGDTTITITVSDGSLTSSTAFVLTVDPVANTEPSISSIANQTLNEDTATSALAFTVGDAETAAAGLIVTATSTNTALVPSTAITLGGSGANRTVMLTPTPNVSGSATITVLVSDGAATASSAFSVTVNPINDVPTISNIANQTIAEDGTTGALAFTVGDVETAAASLVLSRTSSNTTLVPNAAIVLGGSGANRTVTITPAPNQSGTATITITVGDGAASASDTITLTVNAVNDAPTISNIANQAIDEDGATTVLAFVIGDVETATGSLTVTRSSSNATLVPTAGIVLGGSGANRTVTVTPAANQTGTATITISLSDGSLTATDTFTVTVNPVNDAPTMTALTAQTIAEDASTAALAFTITDIETATSSLTVAGLSSNTTLVPISGITLGGSGANRTVTVTPAPNRSGTATVTVTVSDGAASASRSFALTVTAVNDTPTITNIANQSTDEDVAATFAFTVGDAENAASSLVVSGASSNTTLVPNASVTFGGAGGNRTVTVTPAAGLSGSATITVTVSDGTLTASDTFILTINALNDAPTVGNIANQSIAEDNATAALAFSVGDAETSGASLTVSGSSSDTTLVPLAGIEFGGSGTNRTVTVTPAPNRTGTTTITVLVSDGATSTSRSFDVTVTAVNDAPTITNIGNQSTNEDSATAAVAFTIGDAETAAGSLVVTGASSNPTLVPSAAVVFGGSGANRTVTLTPAANQTGTATITITVSDGALSATDTFVLSVGAVNDAPTISVLAAQTIAEDAITGALPFTVGDAETAAGSLTVTGLSSNTALVPLAGIVFGGSGANRTVMVTPAANANGTATITVIVSDGTASTSRPFDVTVSAVNDAPGITNITNQTTDEDTATGGLSFTVDDLETAVGSLVVSGTSSNPTLVPHAAITFGGSGANRTVTVAPAANQSGSAIITVAVGDGTLTASDTFTLTVNAVNDAPTVTPISVQTIAENTTTAALAFTIGDAETTVGSLTVSGLSSNTALVPLAGIVFSGTDANRTITVTPSADQSGSATITIIVSDGTASASRSFDLTVSSVNDAPTITDIANQSTDEDSAVNAVAFVIDDEETDASSLAVTASSSNTTLVPHVAITFGGSGGNRTVTVTPAANQFGTATISVIVSDGSLTAANSFTVSVVPVNDAPTVTAIAAQSVPEDTATAALAFSIGDAETAAGSLIVAGLSSNTTLVPLENIVFGGTNASRTVTITPAPNESGSATITIVVSDGAASISRSFDLTVTTVNDAPTISDVVDLTISQGASPAPLAFAIDDVETAAVSLTTTGHSSNTGLVAHAGIVFAGTGAERTVRVTPIAGSHGSSTITLTVSDGTITSSDTFVFTVLPPNSAPTISTIERHVIKEDTPTGAISFVIGDAETPAADLILTGTSNHGSLLPEGSIVFGGSGANRTVTITPGLNIFGSATVTLTVSDGSLSASRAFQLTVTSVNDAPTHSDIPDRTITQDSNTGLLSFTVADVESTVASLRVTAHSLNLTLVPATGITIGGSGANRTLIVTPAAGRTGTATIRISVTDGSSTRSDTFVLTVTPPAAANQPPTITPIPNQLGAIDTAIGPITFTVGDTESAPASLVVSATSSNPAVVPPGGITLGGNGATRSITLTPATGQIGATTITVSVDDGSTSTSATFIVTIADGLPPGARMLNLSTRVVSRSSQEALIPGFVIRGTETKRVLLRAVGPTLGTAPFNVPGALPDPRLVVKRWNGSAFVDVASNDNWSTNANAGEIREVSASFFAFPVPDNSRDAALLLDLAPGQYTVVADDASGGNGVVILELYDADATPNGSSFINMSNRGYVGTGAQVMISGFVISTEGPKTLLVRAVGPGLAAYGVPNTLSDPIIEIYRRNDNGADTLIASYDNWGENGTSTAIAEIAELLSAFPLTAGSRDAAFVDTFAPGVYTAIVRGVNGATGNALVEVYSAE